MLAAAAAIIIRLRNDEKRYMQALQCAAAIVRHAGRKIRLYSTPTEEILSDFDNGCGRKWMNIRNGTGFKETLLPILSRLQGQEYKVFSEFVEKIGRGYRDDALKLCEYTLACLEERVTQAEAEHPSRMRLYTALPLLSAVSLFVLFL